jgi:hypothetical protein
MSLMGWIVVLFSVSFLNFLAGIAGVKGFLSRNPSIDSRQNLQDFQQMVQRQMYQALLQIGLIGTASILGIYGIITGRLSFGEFLVFLLLNGVNIVIGKIGKGIEGRARSLPVKEEGLASRYEAVCETWVKKPLPNF